MDEEKILTQDMLKNKIKEEVLKKLVEYNNTMQFMATDAPIEVLCLPKQIERALLNAGITRIFELLNCNLREIKGLGVARVNRLTASLNEFIAMF